MRIVTVSSKQQITIPKEILLALGLKHQGKLILEAQEEALVMRPLRTSIVEQTAGSLTDSVSPLKLEASFSTILKEAKKKTAAKLAKNG